LHINCRFNINPQDEDETLEIAALLEKYGADSLQVTKPSSPQFFKKESPDKNILFDLTDKISKHVDIPVILGGGLSNMSDINDLINKTDIDYVSMQRPFVYNPTFLSDWKKNGEGESGCTTCNNCYWKKTSTCHMIAEE
jgi:2,4-dienoyl-CoA reductase-like NADH-dependent reductase (Old Yellow Enzyme family)